MACKTPKTGKTSKMPKPPLDKSNPGKSKGKTKKFPFQKGK